VKRGSKINIYDEYMDRVLYYLYISVGKGPLPLLSNTSYDDVYTVEGFKRQVTLFIKRYKRYFNLSAPFYDAIVEAVNKLQSLRRRQVVREGNVIVEVCVNEISVDVYCQLSIKNITTPILFSLCLPNIERLREGKWTRISFMDKFRFTKIANSKIALTKDEAINMAVKCMEDYFKKHPDELCGRDLDKLVHEVRAEVNYGERGSGVLAPVWRVWIYFNETLPNGVYGFSAFFWADTGEL